MSAPTIAEILGTLDELAAAVRDRDEARHRKAYALAVKQDITDEQIIDAYRWERWSGSTFVGAPGFVWNPVLCETCNDTGEVHIEAQHGGVPAQEAPCPDCDGAVNR